MLAFHEHYNAVIMSATASQITNLMSAYSSVYSGEDQRKRQSSASVAFVRWIHPWPVNSPSQRASNEENSSIWWRHHEGIHQWWCQPWRNRFYVRVSLCTVDVVAENWGISYEIALRWISPDFTDDKSTLVQVMAWCRQATSHYLSQCWPRSVSPNDITRPQWVKHGPVLHVFVDVCSYDSCIRRVMHVGRPVLCIISQFLVCNFNIKSVACLQWSETRGTHQLVSYFSVKYWKVQNVMYNNIFATNCYFTCIVGLFFIFRHIITHLKHKITANSSTARPVSMLTRDGSWRPLDS